MLRLSNGSERKERDGDRTLLTEQEKAGQGKQLKLKVSNSHLRGGQEGLSDVSVIPGRAHL